MKRVFRELHHLTLVLIVGSVIWTSDTIAAQDVDNEVGAPALTCPTPPAACTSLTQCLTYNQNATTGLYAESAPNSGRLKNFTTGHIFSSPWGISTTYFATPGDTIVNPDPDFWIGTGSNYSMQCGFTMAFVGWFNPDPSGRPGVPSKSIFSYFTANGGLGVLSYDYVHFLLTTSLARSGTVTNKATFTQTFWDPVLSNGGTYYVIVFRQQPDGKVLLDVFTKSSQAARGFQWNEGLLDAGLPQLYVCTSSATTSTPCNPAKSFLGQGSVVGTSFAFPYDSSNSQTFTSEGFPDYWGQISLYQIYKFSGEVLSNDQLLALYSTLNTQAAISNTDLNLNAAPNTNKLQLYPCNTGMFLSSATLFPNRWINTPCQSQKPLVSPPASPAVSLSSTALSFSGSPGATSLSQTVTVTNTGPDPLNIYSIFVDQGEQTPNFNETDNCIGTVASGASCAINITYTIGQEASDTANVLIYSDSTSSPDYFTLTGRASNAAQ
jgi:hypothetical protein